MGSLSLSLSLSLSPYKTGQEKAHCELVLGENSPKMD